MSKLLPVFIFSLIMAYISDKRAHIDFNKFGDKIYRHRKDILFPYGCGCDCFCRAKDQL